MLSLKVIVNLLLLRLFGKMFSWYNSLHTSSLFVLFFAFSFLSTSLLLYNFSSSFSFFFLSMFVLVFGFGMPYQKHSYPKTMSFFHFSPKKKSLLRYSLSVIVPDNLYVLYNPKGIIKYLNNIESKTKI